MSHICMCNSILLVTSICSTSKLLISILAAHYELKQFSAYWMIPPTISLSLTSALIWLTPLLSRLSSKSSRNNYYGDCVPASYSVFNLCITSFCYFLIIIWSKNCSILIFNIVIKKNGPITRLKKSVMT